MADAPATDLDALLIEHLRTHEDPCPRCGYVLRGLDRPTCPECGDPLRLELASAAVSDVDWVRALSGFLAASGFYVVGLIAMVTTIAIGGSGLSDLGKFVVLGGGFLGAAGVVALLRRRFRGLRHRRAIGWCLFAAGLGLGFVSLLLVD